MSSGAPQPEKKPRYDHLLKWSLNQAHDDFLALIAPNMRWRAERSPEVPDIERRADLVWEVERPDGSRGVYHMELQIKLEDDIGERIAEYAVRLYRRDHLPVKSLLILLRKTSKTPPNPFVTQWDEQEETLRSSFTTIRLWEIPYQQALIENAYALWPLSSLMAGATIETAVEVAHRLAAAPIPRKERSELIGLLTDLGGVSLPLQALLTALRESPMIDDLLEESPVAQYFREEALKEGAQHLAILALEGRFGPLADDMRAAIQHADQAALEGVVSHVATESLGQLRARLGLS